VIGPEAFMTRDGSVLCYRGHNYVPQPPQAEDHEAGIEAALRAGHANAHREAVENMIAAYLRAARPSPQGEDHEAIERIVAAASDLQYPDAFVGRVVRQNLAALASAPSPERDTERLVEEALAALELISGACRTDYDTDANWAIAMANRAEQALAEIGPAELMDEAVRAESRAVADAHSWRAKAERLKRDTERLMEALRDLIGWAEPSRGGQMAVRRAREALAEFSAGDTKDRR